MSTLAVMRVELRRLGVRPFAWTLDALSVAWLAWNFLIAVAGFLKVQTRLAALPEGPGFTDIVAVPLLAQLAQLAILLAPLLTMSMLAGERRAGTLPLLRAAGLSPRAIVLGKYFAALAWMLLLLIAVAAMPASLAGTTTLDWGKLAAALLGMALALGALTALGLACSAYASHPALAAGAALALTLALWAASLGGSAAQMAGPLAGYLALPGHLETLMRGLVASDDVLYFLLLIALALALAVRRVAADRERG